MLNRYQFEVLRAYAADSGATERDIAVRAGVSLGAVNSAFREMRERGCVDDAGVVTELGRAALAPYEVDNAIVLAAGAGARFAPLSFEKPKALFEVRGEVLIERIIRQLREAGVREIAVVVGYMKESFFYLERDFGVKIIVNGDYASRNNHSSVWRARELLGNSYIVSSDQYFTHNMFQRYCFSSSCSASFSEGHTDEQVLLLDDEDRVVGLEAGESHACFMQGPAYLDRETSRKYLEILDAEYDQPETAGKLWEQVFAEHLDDLHMVMKAFGPGTVYEFDYITDLTAFDRDFFANVDSRILDNICRTLGCAREDISDVVPIKAGLTNLSTLFTAKGGKYIYRHPGNGTEEVINREAEAFALRVASELGFDDTFVYEDPREGWKLSRCI